MTKEQCLQILKLLSALEAWSFATKSNLSDYLLEDLSTCIDVLRMEILK